MFRCAALAVAALGVVAGAAACGGTSSPSATGPGGCVDAAAPGRVEVVVQSPAAGVVQRCVGFSGSTIPALTALQRSGIEVGSQTFSFGLGICQLDNVPAHYSTCLPAGAPYWALFTSKGGGPWTSASSGIGGVTLASGDSLGFRYDSQKGTAAPPSVAPGKG